MAVEAVMQMKDIDKTLFSSNTMMEDDDDGGSVSSLEPLFLSDDNDQSDGKKGKDFYFKLPFTLLYFI